MERFCLVWCSSSLELVGELAHRGSRGFRRDKDLGKIYIELLKVVLKKTRLSHLVIICC